MDHRRLELPVVILGSLTRFYKLPIRNNKLEKNDSKNTDKKKRSQW